MAKVEIPTSESFPSNSHREKEREREVDEKKKDIQQVTSTNATKRKKSIGKKFSEAFIGDESDKTSVMDYILYDVLVPAAKNTLSDMVTGGIEMLLFGERRGRSTSRDRGRSYVNYSSYSRREEERARDRRDSSRRSTSRRLYNDDIILDTRSEAELVIDRLLDIIDDYGAASVADLYALVGIDSEYTDNKYGWTNLSMASVSRCRDGYSLNLPKAYEID